jgi:NAD+ diphosphatase
MLVTDGENCLLGRQSRFVPGMFSCLAGFLEPGETIEDAVRRETFEEAGIRVGRVGYARSQPWPFPSSLMIGCVGEALSREIVIDAQELEEARWFHRDEIRQMLDRAHPENLYAANPIAIAHHLVRDWMEGRFQ